MNNSDVSATPGFYLDFTVENPTDDIMDISLLGALEPNLANKKEGCKNSLVSIGDGLGIHIQPESISNSPSCGNVCLSISGDGDKTYITADYFRFLKEYVGDSDFGVTQESFLFDFRENGNLPNTKIGFRPTVIPKNLHLLKIEKLDALCSEYSQYPFAVSLLKRIQHCTPDFPSNREEKIAFLKCCRRQMWRMGKDFGSCPFAFLWCCKSL